MSDNIRPWWWHSDEALQAQTPKEQPMALDDPQPDIMPAWAQELRDRLTAIECWIKDRMPGEQSKAPAEPSDPASA